MMKKISSFLMKVFKIILLPFNLILLFFYKISGKRKKSFGLDDLAKEFFDTYGDKIMFKLDLGTNGENLTIYSSNFKTTLEKAKKRQKDVIETEITERN